MCSGSNRVLTLLQRSATPLSAASIAALLLVAGARYATLHHSAPEHAVALALAAVLIVASAIVAALQGRRPVPGWVAPSLTVAVGVLVVLAPSSAWAAVPLIVLLHAENRLPVATAWSAVVVGAVAFSVPRLVPRTDPGLVIGCLLTGVVLVGAIVGLRAALASRNALLREVIGARARIADAERRAGAETERQRIAAELHDTVVQSAAGALFLIEASERGGAVPEGIGAEARSALREALEQARGLVDRLETDDGLDAGLIAGLQDAAQAVGAALRTTGTPRELDDSVALTVLRVAQGALGNAQRHADADSIEVVLAFGPAEVSLSVLDDGHGFRLDGVPPGDRRGGHGLAIMRRRCALVGGRLAVTSSASGTVVSASFPLRGAPVAASGTVDAAGVTA